MADMICHKVYELLMSILNTFRPNQEQLRKMQVQIPGRNRPTCDSGAAL
jgi:hypothetical protein